MSLFSLPLELIVNITKFMSINDILSFSSTCKEYRDIILNTRYDKVLRLKSRDIDFIKEYIYKFERVFKLDIDLKDIRIKDASMLGGVHTLDLSYTDIEEVGMLGGVHTLDLSFTKVHDVSS